MKTSIRDVAKRAGVSISTVSRVINHSGGVKENKVDAVKEALAYYNYEPSQFGRGLVTGSSRMIGVYSPSSDGSMFEDGYLLECLRGIDNTIHKSAYSLLLIRERESYGKDLTAKPLFWEYMNQQKIDGLIVLNLSADGRTESFISAAVSQGFPVGYIGKRFLEKGINVYAGFEEYMLDAVGQLYKNGHKKIGLCCAEGKTKAESEIKSKSEAAFPGVNLFFWEVKQLDTIESLQKKVTAFLQKEQLTGIVCSTMDLVMRLQSILGNLGKKIPEDLSVIGVEHLPGKGAQVIPKMNCYYVPAAKMGEEVAKGVLRRLEEPNYDGKSIVFHPEYIARDSVKCFEE